MARKIKVNMTGVESFVRCEEGEHIAVLKEIDEKTASSGSDMLAATFEVVRGSCTGARVYDNFVLTDKALWKLKAFLEIMGIKSDGKIVIDLDKLVGRTCIIEVSHEEYDGKKRSRIDNYKKLEATSGDDEDFEDDEEEEEEEAPAPAPKKKGSPAKKEVKKKKPTPKEEDEDDDDDWGDDD